MNELSLENAISNLMESLARPWADAVGRLLGSSCQVTLKNGEISDPGPNALWMGISFDGLLLGDAALVIPTTELQTLEEKSCDPPRQSSDSASGTPASEIQQHLRQSLVAAMSEFQSQHGPLVGRMEACEPPSWVPQQTIVLEATSADRPAVRVYFLCHSNLRINNLVDTRTPSTDAASGNFKLVMNAALEVTLRFGQQSITLAKLAALGPGSVIELDRKVEEPIDLVLGDRVLARGEVMVVDGNYGLRVTELLDRSQL